MTRINYKSDFDFILRLTDREGNDIGWPPCDWTARLYTSVKVNGYDAGCIGGVMKNCYNDNGRIHVVADNHRLGPGELKCELRLELPDSIYPDGHRSEVTPEPTGITLVSGKGDTDTVLEVEQTLPAVYLTAYDLAVRNGYTGTASEYIGYVNRFPGVVETSEAVMRLIRDIDYGKEKLADALTRQGVETDPAEPIAEMAGKVLGLRLSVDGEEGILSGSWGGLPYSDLLNILYNHQRADYPYCFAYSPVANSLLLTGADAYLCSDGFFTEENCEHKWNDYEPHWVICYFRDADYVVDVPVDCFDCVCLNGRPQFAFNHTPNRLLSYTPEKYTLKSPSARLPEYTDYVALNGVVETTLSFAPTRGRAFFLPKLERITGGSLVQDKRSSVPEYFPALREVSGGTLVLNSSTTTLSLPSLTEMSGGTLANSCSNLTNLSLPSLTEMSGGTLASDCTGLGTIELPSLVERNALSDNLVGNYNKPENIVIKMPRCRIFRSSCIASGPAADFHFGSDIDVIQISSNWPRGFKTFISPGARPSLFKYEQSDLIFEAEPLRRFLQNLGDRTGMPTGRIIIHKHNLDNLTAEDIAMATSKNYSLS